MPFCVLREGRVSSRFVSTENCNLFFLTTKNCNRGRLSVAYMTKCPNPDGLFFSPFVLEAYSLILEKLLKEAAIRCPGTRVEEFFLKQILENYL